MASQAAWSPPAAATSNALVSMPASVFSYLTDASLSAADSLPWATRIPGMALLPGPMAEGVGGVEFVDAGQVFDEVGWGVGGDHVEDLGVFGDGAAGAAGDEGEDGPAG